MTGSVRRSTECQSKGIGAHRTIAAVGSCISNQQRNLKECGPSSSHTARHRVCKHEAAGKHSGESKWYRVSGSAQVLQKPSRRSAVFRDWSAWCMPTYGTLVPIPLAMWQSASTCAPSCTGSGVQSAFTHADNGVSISSMRHALAVSCAHVWQRGQAPSLETHNSPRCQPRSTLTAGSCDETMS